MKDKLNQFIANLQGQFVEVSDRNNLYQCMDLVFNWIFVLDIPKETIQHLYAYEVFTKPNDLTKKFFDLIPNTPDAIPQDGDLPVWNNQFGLAGHIGIALGGGTVNTFRSFEQNAPLGTNANIHTRNYSNILGWLRPKSAIIAQPIAQPINDQTIIDLGQYGKHEVQAIRGFYGDAQNWKKDLKNAKKEIEKLETIVSRMTGELIVMTKDLKECLAKPVNATQTADNFTVKQLIIALINKLFFAIKNI